MYKLKKNRALKTCLKKKTKYFYRFGYGSKKKFFSGKFYSL